jgi:hypothetical protein
MTQDEGSVAGQSRLANKMTSDLWEPIEKYIGKLNSGSMPAVHHYTTLKGALEILKSGRMWFTERTHLNDPSEVSFGIVIAANILRKRDRVPDATRLEASAERVFRDFRFFSASFSFECDDLSQWRNYADGGKGVVLSFKACAFDNPKAYVDELIEDNPTALVCPMSYDSACLENVVCRIIDKWSGADIGELSDHLFMISSMFKNECWRSEKEYRFFIHHTREKILKSGYHKTRERNGQVVSYLDLPIKNLGDAGDFPIYRICLGPAAPEGLVTQLSDFIFSMGLPIQGECISRSNIPFRSVRQI